MRRLLLVIATAAALATAAPAAALVPAQSLIVTPLFGNPEILATMQTTNVRAQISGAITVGFASSPAPGCGGICGYHGTLLYVPGGPAQIAVERYDQAGHRHQDVILEPGANALSGAGAYTWTDVQRDAAEGTHGECVDEQPTGYAAGRRRGGGVAFSLADLLTPTRCAAPLPSGLAPALPQLVLSAAELRRGGRIVVRSHRSFAAGGFSGTVDVDLTVGLGRADRLNLGSGTAKQPLSRVLSEPLTVSRTTGAVTYRFAGSADPAVCVLLDSCGAAGILSTRPDLTGARGTLSAVGPVSRPLRDFLTALGRAHGGRTAGITVIGTISWDGGGSVSETFHQQGTCTASGGFGGGMLIIGGSGGRIGLSLAGSPPRTGCPGPLLQSASGLIGGISRVSGPALTATLTPLHSSAGDDGYTATAAGQVTLRIRAGRTASAVVPQTLFG